MKDIFCIFSIANIDARTFQKIFEEIGTMEEIRHLTPKSVEVLSSLSYEKKKAVLDAFQQYDFFIEELKNNAISYITIDMPSYPRSLKELDDFPYILYYMGDLSLLNKFSIGIIGSRKPDTYGIYCADLFGRKLAETQIVTVSGMAGGIDGIAQKATIANGGKTIAILGSSLKDIYPKSNLSLFQRIIDTGCLVLSEYNHREKTLPYKFVARNRIISALSAGLLVIEANYKSGTMTTVDFALELGKTIFSIPGNINAPNSNGTNLLIKNGAKMTTCIEDILEEYPHFHFSVKSKESSSLSCEENKIMALLQENSPLYIEHIAYRLSMES